MEIIESNATELQTREEFKARLQAAIALTLQLKQKMIQWGERMEERAKSKA